MKIVALLSVLLATVAAKQCEYLRTMINPYNPDKDYSKVTMEPECLS